MQDQWLIVGRLKRAKNRLKILKAIPIDKPFMPSELVKLVYGKSSNTYFNLTSRSLKELETMSLIKIINPKEKTGRLYILTDKGKKIIKLL